ncbi:MAG: cyclic nucleotide-binding domain-containing protein [Solirubrobacterales bacterium]
MKKSKVATGIYWVEIPEVDLRILCGCPADAIKHLMKKDFITTVEAEGYSFETGPNAILLSDLPLQNERFANLAEFPVLQMLYRQGMLLPKHPNNKGVRPMLIGAADCVNAQAEYIFRGNYGLVSLEEIMSTGVSEAEAQEMMRVKLRFAFGRIRPTEELLDLQVVGDEPLEIRTGVFVERKSLNRYEIRYENETVMVDLNLESTEAYEPAYQLGFTDAGAQYFSIIHTGEGDGWDTHRPCMASIVTFQGRYYLVDAGPNLLHSLEALGIGISEIEGVFQTHAHDDHFCGITTLIRSDHRLKYYATPTVRKSAQLKLEALTGITPEQFAVYFDTHDLVPDEWNDIEGLEVKPIYSPHPVETTAFLFRALWSGGYRTYAHLADIVSLPVLKRMISDSTAMTGISRERYNKVKADYFEPANLKKIDVGGGMIHGSAKDFRHDPSPLILSHTALPLTDQEKELGDSATFGSVDVLIHSQHDYLLKVAVRHFSEFFPDVPQHEIAMLRNCPLVSFNPGRNLIRNEERCKEVYYILSGLVDYRNAHSNFHSILGIGSFIGELSCLMAGETQGTYRAASYVKALAIPSELYMAFLNRNGILESARSHAEKRLFLQNTWLFGERISCPVRGRIAREMTEESFEAGKTIRFSNKPALYLLASGEVILSAGKREFEYCQAGKCFGEESIICGRRLYSAKAYDPVSVYRIPAETLKDIPIAQWKLLEVYERRRRGAMDIRGWK